MIKRNRHSLKTSDPDFLCPCMLLQGVVRQVATTSQRLTGTSEPYWTNLGRCLTLEAVAVRREPRVLGNRIAVSESHGVTKLATN